MELTAATLPGKGPALMRLEPLFGQVLQEIRHEHGCSQEQLGFESGYHRTYISLLERGRKNPSLNTIFQLARALDITPSEMMRRLEIKAAESDSLAAAKGIQLP